MSEGERNMNFKMVENECRPIPFWSWNEKLQVEETKRQIKLMDNAGIGGFFMHARGGLQTEYMGDEWFLNVDASIEEAKKSGMRAWAYDENGWPSGFGNGLINGLGKDYQQKYLRMEEKEEHTETKISKSGNHFFYYEINPFYVDTLDKKVTKKFIEKRYKDDIEGFFTDEPQISRNGIPWSFTFESEYKKRYKENILEHLEELFLPVEDYKNTRIKFWKMVTELFSENFFKAIYDWCEQRGLKLTGHLSCEETFYEQLTSNGACMPHYEYFHIPGMDWLGRNIFDCLTPIQLSSASEQLGKKSVLSETFALCGHNVSFAELKGIYEWQMRHGVNLLCQHLEGYSNRGIRKRDYPPAMFIQQPWWSEYKIFNDAMSRVGMVLSESEKKPDILLIHPQTTAWTIYDDAQCEGMKELNDKFLGVMKELEEKHVMYHLGDEILMERHARVENGKIIIGEQKYSRVIVSCCDKVFENTKKLLDEFLKSGGKIVTPADIDENRVIDNKNITYTARKGDGFTVHYFVNTSDKTIDTEVFASGKMLDIETGELKPFSGKYTFEKWGSLMLIDDNSKVDKAKYKEMDLITLPKEMKLSVSAENALTLDMCDYYFDGQLQEKNAYVLDIGEKANALMRKIKIRQDYFVNIEFIPDTLYLVCETPEIFDIFVNETKIEKNINGFFRDKSFKKIEITKYVKMGKNKISFVCDFSQTEETYEHLKKARMFESEKNKVSYDMEIEAVYLVGNFSVKTDGKWETLDKNAKRYMGNFVISKPPEKLKIQDIQMQGYPFFAGEITLSGKINIKGEKPVLKLNRCGINAVRIEINGKTKTMLWSDYLPLKNFGACGETEIKVTLINNLRNLLGPHHMKCGEAYSVAPVQFFKCQSIWNVGWHYDNECNWDADYCFVDLSLEK